jgi:hypothetical protein
MSAYVLLDVVKLEHAEKVRQAERDRLYVAIRKANRRPSVLRSRLLSRLRG